MGVRSGGVRWVGGRGVNILSCSRQQLASWFWKHDNGETEKKRESDN
jgi:hypothetical protein